MNPGNPGVSLLSQCQNRSTRNWAKIGTLFWGEGSKNGVQKCEEDEIKGPKSDILVLVFNMFPRPFPTGE